MEYKKVMKKKQEREGKTKEGNKEGKVRRKKEKKSLHS